MFCDDKFLVRVGFMRAEYWCFDEDMQVFNEDETYYEQRKVRAKRRAFRRCVEAKAKERGVLVRERRWDTAATTASASGEGERKPRLASHASPFSASCRCWVCWGPLEVESGCCVCG